MTAATTSTHHRFVHEGRVYAGSEDAITIFAAAREKKCLGRFEFEGLNLCTPQFAGDRLLVAIDEYVYAFRVP